MGTISKISYSKLFPTSSYLNDRVGIEIDLVAGEDAMSALNEAKELAETFHKQAYPELYKFNEKSLTAEEVATIKEIELCEKEEQMYKFKKDLTVNTKPYYISRLKTLTDNFTKKQLSTLK
jgi:hypothetical protein